jgi:DNA helicase-2/ATP-dependent DNA helicase PcrA
MDASSISLQPQTHRHLENLNQPQKDAVLHTTGPILVLAGAGTGKTRILTRRIANLITQGHARSSSILAVTFTNKAAGEMRQRLQLLVGNLAQALWVSTFHSCGLKILRRYAEVLGFKNDFTVYDAADSKDLIKRILRERNIDEKRYPVQSFSSYIEQQKNIPRFPEDLSKDAKHTSEAQKAEVYDLYQRALRTANAMDFGDLLSFTYQLLTKHPHILAHFQDHLDYILVDEFQDTNDVQYKIVKLLAGKKKNLLVVGDDDQSIYAFRGATIQNILNFEKDFPDTKVIKLEQNYRSTQNVLESAHAVIVKNKGRKDKKLWTSQDGGEAVHLFAGMDEADEAQFIAAEIKKRIAAGLSYQDIACFYRTNAQSRSLEEAFLTYKIPYRVYGGLKFYDRKEIKDLIAYLRLIANPNDNQALLRIINTPARGIGAQTIVQLSNDALQSSTSLYVAAQQGAASSKALRAFVSLIEECKESYRDGKLFDLLKHIVDKTQYAAKLKAMKDDPQAQSRLENIDELLGLAITFEVTPDSDPLQQFLDRVALSSSEENPIVDQQEKSEHGTQQPSQCVSLMTLHLAKGLEYDLVFFTGFEEGLLPHQRTVNNPDEIEEERRLAYVGMTRAKQSLYITRAKKRGMFSAGGMSDPTASRFREASRFSFDLPKSMIEDPLGSFFTSLEYDTYAEVDDEPFDPFRDPPSRITKAKGRSLPTIGYDAPVIKTADSIFEEREKKTAHLPPVQDDDLAIGLRVVHPSFGVGTIESIDGLDAENGTNKKIKVAILFEQTQEVKKLVYQYAGLRLAV